MIFGWHSDFKKGHLSAELAPKFGRAESIGMIKMLTLCVGNLARKSAIDL